MRRRVHADILDKKRSPSKGHECSSGHVTPVVNADRWYPCTERGKQAKADLSSCNQWFVVEPKSEREEEQ